MGSESNVIIGLFLAMVVLISSEAEGAREVTKSSGGVDLTSAEVVAVNGDDEATNLKLESGCCTWSGPICLRWCTTSTPTPTPTLAANAAADQLRISAPNLKLQRHCCDWLFPYGKCLKWCSTPAAPQPIKLFGVA